MRRSTLAAGICLGFAFTTSCAHTFAAGDPMPHHFTGKWITAVDAPAHDPTLIRLRKEFSLPAAPAHFVVHVSADNQFLLMVNGHRVGQGPSIGDLHHWRYETYDLAPFLHAGRNIAAATVWNFGDEAPIRQVTARVGFLLDPDTPSEAPVASDSTWLAHVDRGLSPLPKPEELHDFYYVASPGERLSAAELDWNWASFSLDGSARASWRPAAVLGTAIAQGTNSETIPWQLVPDQLPPMAFEDQDVGHVVRASGLSSSAIPAFPAESLTMAAHSSAVLLLDRATLTTAFPSLVTSGGQGARITMRYAEALVDEQGNKGNRNQIAGKHLIGVADEVILDGSPNRTFTPLDWRTWRYLEIGVATEDQPVTLHSLSAKFTAYPFNETAAFRSNDPALADIWTVGWRTARLCAHDAYMDTPYWERLQYVGDTRIQTLISYTVSGDDRLARQAISAFFDSVLPEGVGQSHYPARALQVIPNFSLLWIGMLDDFWHFRGDAGFVRDKLSLVRSTLGYFRAQRDTAGLPRQAHWWPFVDWATDYPGGNGPAANDGVGAATSLQYLEALRNATELETDLGDKHLADEDRDEADRLAQTIYDQFWNSGEQLLADTREKNHFSQQVNALAVWLDVIPRALQRETTLRIFSATDPGFHGLRPAPSGMSPASSYFRFYLARALVHAGLGDRYLETLAPWKTMLGNGLSTWAEQPEPTRSDSHAWSAHPNFDLLSTVAGLQAAAPGFSSVLIEPHLGNLQQLEVTMPSPHGPLHASYRVSLTSVTSLVTLPPDVSGTLRWAGKAYPLHSGPNTLNLPPTHP